MASLEYPSTENCGVVILSIGVPNANVLRLPVHSYALEKSLPIRVAAVHCCLLGPTLHPIAKFCLTAMGQQLRLRSRIHLSGTYNEKQEEIVAKEHSLRYECLMNVLLTATIAFQTRPCNYCIPFVFRGSNLEASQ